MVITASDQFPGKTSYPVPSLADWPAQLPTGKWRRRPAPKPCGPRDNAPGAPARAGDLSGDAVPQHIFGATQWRAIGQDGEECDRIVFGDRDMDDLDADGLTSELIHAR